MNDWAKYLLPPRRQRSLRFRLVRAGLIAVVAAAIGAFFWAYFIFDSRQNIPLETFVPRPHFPLVTDSVFIGLEDATAELCDDQTPCNQAYRGERVTLFRFDTRDDATALAGRLKGDGYRSNWIAVHYTDLTVTHDERFYVEQSIEGTWSNDW